ncbi:MAG: glycosyltransferase family 1 protein, partial [Dolichospermum sp.]
MSNLTTIIAIVPRLPPAIDGVGDYALNLARQLRKDFNIHTHFIVGNSTWKGASEIEGFTVSQITDNSASTLVTLLSSNDKYSSILLHYVGYGYAQRGCPVWLVQGLEHWKSLYPKNNLVTMFHELYASGYPPWTSPFWLFPLQKSLTTQLAKLSDHGWTSMENRSKLLAKITQKKHCPIFSLPVFSTIGESEVGQVSPLSKRQPKLVIFGTYGRRLPIYQKSMPILRQIVRDLEIKEILDIGKPLGINLKEIDNVPIITLGEQPPENINS